MEVELELRSIRFQTKREISLSYKGRKLEKTYIPDLFVSDAIVVELKAAKCLAAEHEAQLFNYLRIAGQPVGYLLNFGKKSELEWKRFVLTDIKNTNPH